MPLSDACLGAFALSTDLDLLSEGEGVACTLDEDFGVCVCLALLWDNEGEAAAFLVLFCEACLGVELDLLLSEGVCVLDEHFDMHMCSALSSDNEGERE